MPRVVLKLDVLEGDELVGLSPNTQKASGRRCVGARTLQSQTSRR